MIADHSSAAPVQTQNAKRMVAGLDHRHLLRCRLLKPGPGTWGSVAALLLWAAYARLAHPATHALLLALAIGIALTLVAGIPAATIVERESGHHDPGFVVIDEVAGQWVALLASPVDWRHGLIALVLFRLFDIVKPFPVRRLERLPAGWGIVFDDVAAGLYALV